ncbi:MFS transporter [Chryseobacterium indologenes]|uniref:MFS transporter n=1 Tax=Chryseobacterium indologenes TaxID=253 RepID=UPI0020173574|nr:MFS transporter [Chryseobacterium indologenes]
MQAHKIPVFKTWVPEWLARSVIFAILMTCLFSFAYYSSPASAMGFYGVQVTDVQYGMVVIYGSTVAFLALDFRIVKYFAPRKYLFTAFSANIICSLICFYTKDWTLFVICQFMQGITCALISGIVLQLIFPRLQSTRARIIAYSLLYGSIQIAVPFYSIYSSIVLYFYNFNWLFYGLIIILILLVLIVLATMNGKARFTKKIPLYQVDWAGYLFYVSFILILGYILVYGRQLGWCDNSLIVLLSLGNVTILVLFVARELKLKRPLINLQIFRTKNFVIGLLLLFLFYIFKGSTGLAYGYLEAVLGNDPLSTIPIWITVITGTTLGMFVTSRLILMGFNLIRIIITGFGFMALYYVYMLIFISVQGNTTDFILPMFIYGTATGILFVPIVSFTISAAPPKIASNASLIGILARFIGFTASLAVNNELQLFAKSAVREKARETLTETNIQLPVTLMDIQNHYMNAGNDMYTAKAASVAQFNILIRQQILARATRDYYDWMLVGVMCVIMMLLLLPQIQQVLLRLRKGNIPY